MRELQPVGGALQQLLRQLGLERHFRTYDALAHWSDIVGKQIAQVARPLRLDADTLWIAVKSHAWAQELNFQKGTILKRLNERAGEERFKELRFTVRASLPAAVVGRDADATRGGFVGGDADATRGGVGGGDANATRSGVGGGDANATRSGVGGGDANATRSGVGGGDANATEGVHVASASLPTISETELVQIESSLASVSDPVLRDALKRAQIASLHYQKRLAQLGWRRCVVCECYHSDDSAICYLCEQGV